MRVEYLNLRESMRNGGGPACLRLRVVLTDEQIGIVDRTVGRITAGLPQHYFEELRRAVIARSDRRGQLLIDELGPHIFWNPPDWVPRPNAPHRLTS